MSAKHYVSKINKVLKFINEHLEEDLDVAKLAKLSGFSLFHFHRIFKSLTNESPYEALFRLRLEKSVFLLKYRKTLKIADIAYATGFTSPENFTRQFKARFNVSPSVYRKDEKLQNSRIYQEDHPNDFYFRVNQKEKRDHDFEVTIDTLNEMPIAYQMAVFGADGSGLVEKYLELMAWADKYSINIKGPLTRFGMSIDNPDVTPASKYRYDFALNTFHTFPLEKGIQYGQIPPAQYATVHVIGILEDVARAWDYLYRDWLPESGYVPMHYPAIEEFVKGPEEIGWDKFNLKCRIPLRKL